jgi:serine/threonine-protein kinase RsbW
MGMREAYPAIPEAVGWARQAARASARRWGAGEQLVEVIALAVSEAVTNAVLHAYRHDGQGEVVLEAEPAAGSPDALLVRVRDAGCGMGPRPDSPGLGMGLPLIGRLADDVRVISPPGGGTEVAMRFPLGVGAAAYMAA